ncbi:uncharacterized protein F5Z01DRAFT_658884 [Emericellopsis atlantica]|uniref:Uncharacterized protein n=1 Tax=Emericellopsis atlantica TaxID=2614577 RepID=A0A9P7ZJ96_9HYPO|nr:uncharacterized protein F5Z01DRAFT_658884 [Emericellopsis atlantica]KAG9252956.1 hypothetical protein F5Z01DRAFT_658884 [Emericellopsis atlantica]
MPAVISLPSANPSSKSLIYFITGNPGLVKYYEPFLTLLSSLTHGSHAIYGRDLFGFSQEDTTLYDLEEQIECIYTDLRAQIKAGGYENVILMGHSVGTYIAVEIIARSLARADLTIQGAILITPTLTELGKSPRGKQLGRLMHWPVISNNAYIVAKGFLFTLPDVCIKWVLGTIMGFTPAAAEVTRNFLRSSQGVREALHLGVSEIHTIKEDVWADEVFQVAEAGGVKRLFALYADEDYWVDDEVRQVLVKRRGEDMEWMVESVRHDFPTTEESTVKVARIVSNWVEQIKGEESR